MRAAQLVDIVEAGTDGEQACAVAVEEEELEAPVAMLAELESFVDAVTISLRKKVQGASDLLAINALVRCAWICV